MLLLIFVVLVVLACAGAFPVHARYGYAGSGGWVGAILIIVVVLYLIGYLR